ncbi:unnamed protein product [Victoria cruziana]
MRQEGHEEAEGKGNVEGKGILPPFPAFPPNSGDRSSSGDGKLQWLHDPNFSFDVSEIHNSVGAIPYEPVPGSDKGKHIDVGKRPS